MMKQMLDNNSRRCHIAISAPIYVDQIVFRKALIICQFSKSITNFSQLPTVWGEAITCRSSPTLRPDHFATTLPHYCANSLIRYRISTLIR